MLKNVLYRFDCVLCKEKGSEKGEEDAKKMASYIGETARTAYENSKEHEKLKENMDKGSPMVEHQVDKHPGLPFNVSIKVIRRVPQTLDRNMLEGK